MNKDIAPVLVGGIGDINFGKQYRQGNRIYDANSIAMALLSSPVGNAGGFSYLYMIEGAEMNKEGSNKIMIDEVKRIVSATRKCDIGVTVHDNGDIRPHRLDKKKSGISEMQINKDTNISNTVTASHMPKIYGDSTNLRIRKLTPKECWRLMGFDDEDFYKAEAVNSNSQLYKQAGNSIVVDVIVKIYEKLFERYGDVIK